MRALTGYLVAHGGDERPAVRAALGTPQQLRRREQRTDQYLVINTFCRNTIGDAAVWMDARKRMSIANARAATNKFPADRGLSGNTLFLRADDRLAADVGTRRR